MIYYGEMHDEERLRERVRQNIPLYLQTEIQNKVSKTLQC